MDWWHTIITGPKYSLNGKWMTHWMPISPKLEFKDIVGGCMDLNCNSQMERITRTKVANQTHFGILSTPLKDNLQRYTLQLGVKLSQIRVNSLCICILNSVTCPKMKVFRSRVAIICFTKLTSQQTKNCWRLWTQIFRYVHLFTRVDFGE